jgi:cysteine-rich repeat protein
VRDGTPGQAGIEECDDGNRTAGDGYDATCQLEAPDCDDDFDG